MKTKLPGTIVRAFTLLELLVVIVIIGIIAGMALPVMNHFKPNYTASATRTLLDELARARQLAISQRTTVFMVFVPTNFWMDANYNTVVSDPVNGAAEKVKLDRLLDKQLIGYNLVSLRSLGDQPGRPSVRYLSSWKSLPEGAFIVPQKFADVQPPPIPTNNAAGTLVPGFPYGAFPKTTKIPFPSEFARAGRPASPYIKVPYIAFDYMGRLLTQDPWTGAPFDQTAAYRNFNVIPLARGNILYSRDKVSKEPIQALPTITEQPPGNSTNAYNLVSIEWLTGRARGIQQEVR